MFNKPVDKIICIVNKRTAYSDKPRLTVGKTYILKSKIMVKDKIHFELREHPGFLYPYDHFNTLNVNRTNKLKELNKK